MDFIFESFGFKHGIPVNADVVFDARCLPNPHWKPNLRPLTGKDKDVIDFLEAEQLFIHQRHRRLGMCQRRHAAAARACACISCRAEPAKLTLPS